MYDVIVIGLGGMGSASAQHLAARGLRVLGIEQYTPLHELGSSHGSTRIYRQSYWEHPAYVPLLLRSCELWRELESRTGEQILHMTGGLYVGRPEGELLAGALTSATTYNLPHELLNADQIRSRFPFITPQRDEIGLLEVNAGYLLPERCVALQQALARQRGAELVFQEQVLSWTQSPGQGVMVKTDRGFYQARKLVLACGAWAPEMLSALGLPLTVTRQVLFWMQPAGDISAFSPERCPIYVFESEQDRLPIYGFPATEGDNGGVKVAIHGAPETCTPQDINRQITDVDLERIRAKLALSLPQLNHAVLKAKTCLYTMTPDEHFIVGAHPELSSVVYAAGFSGHGFKFASVIGEILADLVCDGATRHPIDLFASSRFASEAREGSSEVEYGRMKA